MNIALITIGASFLAIWLWLAILGYFSVNFDETLDWQEQRTQKLIVLLVPIFGAVFILHVTNINYPGAIPRAWIPWPLKNLICGKNHEVENIIMIDECHNNNSPPGEQFDNDNNTH